MRPRRQTRPVQIGGSFVGGQSPISVQAMTKTDTRNIEATIEQIRVLEEAGAEIIRLAIPDMEAAEALKSIKKAATVPLVADIHFNHQLALKALEYGIDKLRINPGNIGDKVKVKRVVNEAKARGVPIRIGVNAGSLEKDLLYKYGRTPEAMVESALGHIAILEHLSFYDTIVSLKASDVITTVKAYELLAEKVDYPFHLGITEAGTRWAGTIKSSVGIGYLLAQGIGDTLRVSLTGDTIEEVKVGFEILASLDIRHTKPEIVSCPTCGRLEYDMLKVVEEIEQRMTALDIPLKIAIMGCAVNGPGESLEADVGLAGGYNTAMLFRKGEMIKKIPQENMVEELWQEILALANETKK